MQPRCCSRALFTDADEPKSAFTALLQRMQQLEAQLKLQEQQEEAQQQRHVTACAALQHTCHLKDAQIQQLHSDLLQSQQEQQQLLQHQQRCHACQQCNVLHCLPSSSAGLPPGNVQQQQCQLIAQLAGKLQRTKQKLSCKREQYAALKVTNNQLVGQLVQLKASNAGLSMKLAALTAAATTGQQQHAQHSNCTAVTSHLPTATAMQQQLLSRYRSSPARQARAAVDGSGQPTRPENFTVAPAVRSPYRCSTAAASTAAAQEDIGSSSPINLQCSQPSPAHTAAAAIMTPQKEPRRANAVCARGSSSATSELHEAATPAASRPATGTIHTAELEFTGPAAQRVTSQQASPSVAADRAASSMLQCSNAGRSSNSSTDGPLCSSSSTAAAEHVQAVLQELQLLLDPRQMLEKPLLHAEQQQEVGDGEEWEEAVCADASLMDASSSSSSSSCLWAGSSAAAIAGPAYTRQKQKQQYSIERTGGGYQPYIRDEAAEGLLWTAAVQSRMQVANSGAASSPRKAGQLVPWQDVGTAANSSGTLQAVRPADGSAGSRLRRVAAGGLDRGCTAKFIAGVPKEAVAVMQDFYRQHCCVAWPLATAARALNGATDSSRSGLRTAASPIRLASHAAVATAASAASESADSVITQPLLPWHVLEGLLGLLHRAFRKRERERLQLLKARCDKQLLAMKRRIAAAASLPQVLEQGKVQHLKAQLQAARHGLAVRDKGQHAAVLKVAERGYHLGRQVDQLHQQQDQLQLRLQHCIDDNAGLRATLADAVAAAEAQKALLLQRVSDAFVSGARWQKSQAAVWLQQLLLAVADGADALAAAAATAAESCWEGLCPGVQQLVQEEQRVISDLTGFITAAVEEVQCSS